VTDVRMPKVVQPMMQRDVFRPLEHLLAEAAAHHRDLLWPAVPMREHPARNVSVLGPGCSECVQLRTIDVTHQACHHVGRDIDRPSCARLRQLHAPTFADGTRDPQRPRHSIEVGQPEPARLARTKPACCQDQAAGEVAPVARALGPAPLRRQKGVKTCGCERPDVFVGLARRHLTTAPGARQRWVSEAASPHGIGIERSESHGNQTYQAWQAECVRCCPTQPDGSPQR
jgi:hypothetical protein